MSAFIQYTLQGLAAGGFYALSALGLAVIFGVLGVVNFSHGACYMLGAVLSAVLLAELNVNFWLALVLVPILMFGFGVLMERADPLAAPARPAVQLPADLRPDPRARRGGQAALRRLGAALPGPPGLSGQVSVGNLNLPTYAIFACLFSVAVCVGVGLLLTRTDRHDRARGDRGSRAHPGLGINVGRWVTPVFGFGIALAGLAGVLAAPTRAITAEMGSNFIIILFAVVVIGGLGSILGAVVAEFLVGLVEAYGVAYAPAYAQIVIFILMALVILVRPAGLFGRGDRR